MLALATALSAFFSWIEALYSHYKNNFSFRIQWSPIIIAPLLIIASIGADLEPYACTYTFAYYFTAGVAQRHDWLFLSCARCHASSRWYDEAIL